MLKWLGGSSPPAAFANGAADVGGADGITPARHLLCRSIVQGCRPIGEVPFPTAVAPQGLQGATTDSFASFRRRKPGRFSVKFSFQ